MTFVLPQSKTNNNRQKHIITSSHKVSSLTRIRDYGSWDAVFGETGECEEKGRAVPVVQSVVKSREEGLGLKFATAASAAQAGATAPQDAPSEDTIGANAPAIEPLAPRPDSSGAWAAAEPLTAAELERGFACCLAQIDANMSLFGEDYPTPATRGNRYGVMGNSEWTNGFWTGQLWLAYERTGEARYRSLAEKNVESFLDRVERRFELDHHDLGFLYVPSCVAAYRLTGSERARTAALLAADQLLTRWRERGAFLQAWGPMDSREHYRLIIDCLLNVPLLYWAADETGDAGYADKARRHFETTCANIIRPDGSAFHTFYMDPETGAPGHGATRQGYSDDSAWARGQAWGICGIPLNIRHTGLTDYFPYAVSMRNYFLNRLPKDDVCYWDLVFGEGSNQSRDSSAAAIAACGLDEMARLACCPAAEADVCRGAEAAILRSLIENYTARYHEPGEPILYHGVYSWHSGKGVDEGNVWGDYFFLEALTRAAGTWDPYW